MVYSTRVSSAHLFGGGCRSAVVLYTVLLCVLCSPLNSFAQSGSPINRASATNWYFGRNAGLSFTGGLPQILTDGKVNTSGGSTVISHPATGQLLFYTDGRTVWNANHAPMPNGDGLLGAETSGQPALVVPSPGDANIFYIFTTGQAGTANTATRYSIVDMSLDGGRGDVTEKNIALLNNGTEKIAATRHCNGRDYWVVTHELGSNRFFAYPVTKEGIGNSVASFAGMNYTVAADMRGTIQIAPNGKTLAASTTSRQSIELFDFDNATGLVTNARTITTEDQPYYGLEFSPDNTKLYAGTLQSGTEPAYLYQFNLAAGNTTAVRNSRHQLREMAGTAQGAGLQLGPDGKLYVSWFDQSALSIINQPNGLRDACGYQHNVLDLGGQTTGYNLPNFIDSDIPGVTTGFVALDVTVEFDRARAEHGETVLCRIIICNGSANDVERVSVALQYPIELKNVAPPPGGTYVVDRVPANGCDTLEVRLLAGGREGTVSLCARLINVAPNFFCLVPDTGCASITLVTPSDPNLVDYEYYFRSKCPGFTEGVEVLFNSRRFGDTIIDVQFEGDGASYFAYGGERPIQYVIHPTSDQWFPVVLRHTLPGRVTAVMKLVTSSGDVFRIRLISDVNTSVTPIFNTGEILVRERTGVLDTCITVTNRSGMRLVINDSLWLARGNDAQVRFVPLTLPQYIPDGGTMQLCFSITDPTRALSDTFLITGYENTDFLPSCVNQMIVIRGVRPDTIITSVESEGTLNGTVRMIPNPIAGSGAIEVVLEKGEHLRLSIVDERGREVLLLAEKEFRAGRQLLAFDVGAFSSGAYSVVAQGERGRRVAKIQVIR